MVLRRRRPHVNLGLLRIAHVLREANLSIVRLTANTCVARASGLDGACAQLAGRQLRDGLLVRLERTPDASVRKSAAGAFTGLQDTAGRSAAATSRTLGRERPILPVDLFTASGQAICSGASSACSMTSGTATSLLIRQPPSPAAAGTASRCA